MKPQCVERYCLSILGWSLDRRNKNDTIINQYRIRRYPELNSRIYTKSLHLLFLLRGFITNTFIINRTFVRCIEHSFPELNSRIHTKSLGITFLLRKFITNTFVINRTFVRSTEHSFSKLNSRKNTKPLHLTFLLREFIMKQCINKEDMGEFSTIFSS